MLGAFKEKQDGQGGWCRMSKEENAKREEGIRGP